MPLSDTAIRALKPRDKDYRVTDEKGLYLQITPAGWKLGRLKYRNVAGTEKKKLDGLVAKVSAANPFSAVAQSYIDKCKREDKVRTHHR